MDSARSAARRAYERDRLFTAIIRATAILPAGLAVYITGASFVTSVSTSLVMFLYGVFGGWWRTDLGRGAVAGAATIVIPMVLSVYMQTVGCAMTPAECASFCFYGSAILGCAAGYFLGEAAAVRSRKNGFWFAGATVTTATFAVVVGCTTLGFGSTFGLTFGLLLVGVPTFAWVRAAA